MLKTGDDVDSWCGACKLILAHTIEAIVADSPGPHAHVGHKSDQTRHAERCCGHFTPRGSGICPNPAWRFPLGPRVDPGRGGLRARVHCNTCKAQHKYRPHKPSKVSKNVRQRKARTSSYEKLLNGKDISLAKRYSTSDSYVLDDVVEHPSFGVGVTTTIKDGNKIEVVFENGMKTLVHRR